MKSTLIIVLSSLAAAAVGSAAAAEVAPASAGASGPQVQASALDRRQEQRLQVESRLEKKGLRAKRMLEQAKPESKSGTRR